MYPINPDIEKYMNDTGCSLGEAIYDLQIPWHDACEYTENDNDESEEKMGSILFE